MAPVADPPVLHGAARVRQLWTLFRNEQADPAPFYTVLAREAVADLDRRYGPLAGQTIADLGCGPGFYTRAFRAAGATVLHGAARVRHLWRLFRQEQTDPAPFYTALAREAVADLDRRYGPIAGQTIADLGCGPGFYTRAFRAAGATVLPVDNSEDELALADDPPQGAIIADAADLPFDDASIDGAFASNLLEHAPDTAGILREIERVLRPGGWGYISWTNWYSPWGGHDMSPYHFLGPERGPKAYERRHGPPRKNRYGEGLWAVHVGSTLKLVRARPRLEIERVEPRYWPKLSFITAVPGLREVASWNCVIRVRKT